MDMEDIDNSFIDKVAERCINFYNQLPKTGKPVEKEWTVLSCVLGHDVESGGLELVALGTGSKCIGATKMSGRGDILNDSHAEVFARRGFLVYLYDNIEKAVDKKQSIFEWDNTRLRLKSNIKFIFYSTQLPCGDASIIAKVGDEELFGDIVKTIKRPANDDNCDVESKVQKTEDIHRTGAKCLPNAEQDPKLPGTYYHLSGQVRTKPGRGDRTLSVSCSDKMAKWVHLGIQGSLINLFLQKPIFISHFIFGGGVPYCKQTLERAFLNRSPEYSQRMPLQVTPQFHQSSLVFPDQRSEENIRPAPGSIVWVNVDSPILEVAVQGKKLGVTKKKACFPSSSLCISKFNLYQRFHKVVSKFPESKRIMNDEISLNNIPYSEMKRKSSQYMEKWSEVKEKFFKIWTNKPDMFNFCINDT